MKLEYDLPAAGVTPSQLEALRPYLVGERPRDDGEWDMFCPLHEDRNRSAQINIDKAQWYCHAGCGGGNVAKLIERKSEWIDPRAARSGSGSSRPVRRTGRSKEEITDERVAGWMEALFDDIPVLDELKSLRGIWDSTIKDFEIGRDNIRDCFTIPVRDASGKLLNIRRYQPRPPKGRRKMWGVEGMNGAHLFPIVNLRSDSIIICEGEWDAIVTTQHGFPAITRTASAITWSRAWNRLFRGKTVYLCHDMDDAGQKANRKAGLGVSPYAREVRVVRLPYPLSPEKGKDLSDYWLDHDGDADEFRRLLEEAVPFEPADALHEPETIGPTEVAVLDAFDARGVGKPLQLTVTIKGKRAPGYSIPRRAEFRCDQDAGIKCNDCPLNSESGESERIVAGSDPVVLELMDATKGQVYGSLRRMAHIPECQRLRIRVLDHQSVEQLYARPSVDHSKGNGAGDYATIKLTSVGRHDTQPNSTVRVVGALQPDPRKQLNEFLAWDVAQLETSLDRFDFDRETLDQLKKFQPRPGQSPLKRVRNIADDLAANVTRIYGRPELHAAMDLVFHSVISFYFDGKLITRGWLDLLVVGDPRTGKSEVGARLCRHYRAGEMVSCETATLAGIIGGLQQFGSNKEWAITWGAVPLNDRRLVVLDEISGLAPEDIASMSSVRSSGVAELIKIQQERTYARTRLIWMGNPRNARMSDFTYGVQAIRPLIGNAEDIARFDLAMSVAAGEVPSSEINRARPAGAPTFDSESCSLLIRWAWSRTAEQIIWARGAEEAVFRAADRIGGRYVEDPPLIQSANVREKVARIAVAIAVRTFSCDESGERVIVRSSHVHDAVSFIDALYEMKGFGYAERSKELIGDAREAREKSQDIKVVLYNKPWLAKFLRSAGKFRRQDLEEIGNIDREQANAIIQTLWSARMVVKDKGDVRLTPTLHKILREINV